MNGLTIEKKADFDVPPGFLKQVGKIISPKSLGVMFIDAEKGNLKAATVQSPTHTTIKEFQNVIKQGAIFYCGAGINQKQPFQLLTKGDLHQLAMMGEGDFLSRRSKSTKSPLEEVVEDIIMPQVLLIWELTGGNLDKFVETLKKDASLKLFGDSIKSVGSLTFMAANGNKWSIFRGKAMKEFDWGSTSDPIKYTGEEVVGPSLLEAVQQPVTDVANRIADAAKAVTSAAATAVRQGAAPSNNDPVLPGFIGGWPVKMLAKSNKHDSAIFDYEDYMSNFPEEKDGGPPREEMNKLKPESDQNIRKAYHRLLKGKLVPDSYKDCLPIVSANAAAFYKKKLEIQKGTNVDKGALGGTAKPTLTKPKPTEGAASGKPSEPALTERQKHILRLQEEEEEEQRKAAEEEERKAKEAEETPESPAPGTGPQPDTEREFVPILSAEQKEKLKMGFLMRLYDEDGNVLQFDPGRSVEVTSSWASFSSQMGLGGIFALFNLDVDDLRELVYEDPDAAVIVMRELMLGCIKAYRAKQVPAEDTRKASRM